MGGGGGRVWDYVIAVSQATYLFHVGDFLHQIEFIVLFAYEIGRAHV
jgi:hypothetical protein